MCVLCSQVTLTVCRLLYLLGLGDRRRGARSLGGSSARATSGSRAASWRAAAVASRARRLGACARSAARGSRSRTAVAMSRSFAATSAAIGRRVARRAATVASRRHRARACARSTARHRSATTLARVGSHSDIAALTLINNNNNNNNTKNVVSKRWDEWDAYNRRYDSKRQNENAKRHATWKQHQQNKKMICQKSNIKSVMLCFEC